MKALVLGRFETTIALSFAGRLESSVIELSPLLEDH
jgi:hypothetical protein